MSTVYTCFCTDIIHAGHLNIINEAKKYEKIVNLMRNVENDLCSTSEYRLWNMIADVIWDRGDKNGSN